MSDIFDILLTAGFWAATIRIVSPLIFGTLGELICERAGVLNLGIEGIMTVGAMAGWMWVYQGGDLWTGVLFAAFVGAMFGLLHAIFTVHLGLSQHVTGIGITLFASSLSYFVYRMLLPSATTPPKIEPFQSLDIPILSDLPWFGEALFQQSALTYLAIICVPLVWYVLFRTPVGLAVRMAGENPVAVEAQGINVLGHPHRGRHGRQRIHGGRRRIYHHVLVRCVLFRHDQRAWLDLCGLGHLRLVATGPRANRRVPVCRLRSVASPAQQSAGAFIPYQFFLALPYVMSILAMIVMAHKTKYPQALLVPFRRGERV